MLGLRNWFPTVLREARALVICCYPFTMEMMKSDGAKTFWGFKGAFKLESQEAGQVREGAIQHLNSVFSQRKKSTHQANHIC